MSVKTGRVSLIDIWDHLTLLVTDREDLPLAFADFGSICRFDREVVSA